MRKVLFRVFRSDSRTYSDFKYEGLFHQWGVSYETGEYGYGNFTVGIVELPDGTIRMLNPDDITFVS